MASLQARLDFVAPNRLMVPNKFVTPRSRIEHLAARRRSREVK
jgi:hypothetical protein